MEVRQRLLGVIIKAYVKVESAAIQMEIDTYSKVPEEDYEPSFFWRYAIHLLFSLASCLEKVLSHQGITKDFLKWEVYDELIE